MRNLLLLRRTHPLGLVLTLTLGAPGAGVDAGTTGSATGVILYRVANSVGDGVSLFRIEATNGAVPENLTQALDVLYTDAPDEFANVSPDGRWLLLSTDRFDAECVGWACLVVVASDPSSPSLVRSMAGDAIHPSRFSAIASGGDLVVFPSNDGPHPIDLFVISRSGGNWGNPILLTSASPHDYNAQPAIAADGATVAFDCGPVPFGQDGTGLCVVGTDGAGFADILAPTDPDAPSGTLAIHHTDFAPDGSFVMEIATDSETLWRLPPGVGSPSEIAGAFTNDNSPCVLPDGRIVSLWLNSPSMLDVHELKVMDPDGGNSFRLALDIDVVDDGIGCGGADADAIFASDFETGDTSDWSSQSQ